MRKFCKWEIMREGKIFLPLPFPFPFPPFPFPFPISPSLHEKRERVPCFLLSLSPVVEGKGRERSMHGEVFQMGENEEREWFPLFFLSPSLLPLSFPSFFPFPSFPFPFPISTSLPLVVHQIWKASPPPKNLKNFPPRDGGGMWKNIHPCAKYNPK